MIRLISSLKRVVTVFLAGLLIIVSTACSGGVPAKAATNANANVPRESNPRPEVPEGAVSSPFQGGMKNYSDVDPRVNEKPAQTKAKALVDKTARNEIDLTDDVGTNTKRTLDKKAENAAQLGENAKQDTVKAGEKTKSSAEDFAKGTQRGTENIKANTQDAAKDVSKNAAGAAENAKQNVGNAGRDAAKAADSVK